MKKITLAFPLLASSKTYATIGLDTSSPAAFRSSVTRMADEAGRGNYARTRTALLEALDTLQTRFIAESVRETNGSWGYKAKAQDRFNTLMKGKTREQILAMYREGSPLH